MAAAPNVPPPCWALSYQSEAFGFGREAFADMVGRIHAGNTFLKGFTLMPAYTPAARVRIGIGPGPGGIEVEFGHIKRPPLKPAGWSLLSMTGKRSGQQQPAGLLEYQGAPDEQDETVRRRSRLSGASCPTMALTLLLLSRCWQASGFCRSRTPASLNCRTA